MHNSYGRKLRGLVSSRYSVDLLWSMHNVDAFEETVPSYPAIAMISNRKQGSVQIMDCPGGFNSMDLPLLWAFTENPTSPVNTGSLDARTVPDWNYGGCFLAPRKPETSRDGHLPG